MSRVLQEIPKVGLVMEAVKVVRWLKAPGDIVRLGDPLVEVETEKSVIEIEATIAGVLAEALLAVDQEANVGDPLAWIEVEGTSAETAGVPSAPAAEHVAAPRAVTTSAPVAPVAPVASGSAERIPASPAARRLASESGLELASIKGSGPRGRIELDDVRRAQIATSAPAKAAATSMPVPPTVRGATTSPTSGLTPMRRALARAMTLSNAAVPQFPVERDVDWTRVQATRAELNAALPTGAARVSVNDFLLHAIAHTLIEFPALNARFTGSLEAADARLESAHGAHIGLVLAVDGGLVVPVLHDVEQLSVTEIAARRTACVERGLNGVLKREELAGATISLSNLGSRGPDRFIGMINPPESAILAVGRQRDVVTVVSGQMIAIRPISTLTLTVDHRVADGRLAADFLARVVERLEQ